MTNRERVIASINFKKTDYIPHNVDFTEQIYEKITEEFGSDYLSRIDNHITVTDLSKPQIKIKDGYFRDEFGVVWNKTGADKDIGIPDKYLIKTESDLDNYVFPPVDEKFIRSQCEKLTASDDDNFRMVNIGFSLYERVWTLMGIEDTLCNMLIEPEMMHGFFKRVCQRNLEILDIALEYDFDGVLFGDDWGQQKHLIMGRNTWCEFIKPNLKLMYEKVKSKNKYVAQHSCGDIREIMDDLIELGLNVYQTYQPEIYGLDYAKNLQGKIAIWGGISTQHDLPYKTPGEIKEITKNTINHFKETGGLIASPTHSVPADVPLENIKAMIDVFLDSHNA